MEKRRERDHERERAHEQAKRLLETLSPPPRRAPVWLVWTHNALGLSGILLAVFDHHGWPAGVTLGVWWLLALWTGVGISR